VAPASFNNSPQSMGLLETIPFLALCAPRHETEMDQRRHQTIGQNASVLCWRVRDCQLLQGRWPYCRCACWRGPVADYNRSPRLRGILGAAAMTEGMFVFGSTASRPLSPSQCRAGASGSVTTSPKAEDDAVRPAAWRLPGKLNLGIVFPDRCKPRIGLPFGVEIRYGKEILKSSLCPADRCNAVGSFLSLSNGPRVCFVK
jgi:hypothetical protein